MSRYAMISAFLMLSVHSSVNAAEDESSAAVFERRLAPIFKSSNPSSCVKCHLATVDLKDYILPSSQETFLALRDQGLIDLDKPEKSKILTLIERGAEAGNNAASVAARQQKAEHEAFSTWIKACAADPALRALSKPQTPSTLKVKPVEVVRHARKDRLLESFETNIWAMRFRCMNCHIEGTPQNDKLRKEHGDRVAWFKKDGPQATMEFLLASKLIDDKEPEKSLLMSKPLGTVKHGGGVKFALGDQGYKAYRAWIDDVVAIRTGKIVKKDDVPSPDTGPRQYGTEVWFKLTNTPESWANKLLQVDIYAWDASTKAWEKAPLATSDRLVGGKGNVWQHTLTLQAAADSDRAKAWKTKPTLPPGQYLVKVYVDTGDRLKKDWKSKIGTDDYQGMADFQAKWKDGYNAMTEVNAAKLTR